MAKNCEVCGREFDALYPKTSFENHEVCKVCKKQLEASEKSFDEVKKQILEEIRRCNDFVDYDAMLEKMRGFPATTGMAFEGYKITDYLGITGGETALGTGLYADFAAAIYDIKGTESPELTDKIRKAKDLALAKLIENCKKLGANAVIGVNFELATIDSIMIASANGTAVRIEKK
ncbi:MAG: heavy metal-binding domain-containing protein [Oscillospiraceae bacterium]|nr:heavy metal-binding domain-containing protein [Oscillospiraceae bacterium]